MSDSAKKPYIKPELTVVTFQNELGYMASSSPLSPNYLDHLLELYALDSDQNYSEMESFSQHSTWTADDKSAFWE